MDANILWIHPKWYDRAFWADMRIQVVLWERGQDRYRRREAAKQAA